ncbi:(R,S)-reticuline 7-O-methyltransferase-like [Silene latifolia]|uniref:(R,S)-reticuline 7-O-methyltransferase-like n=1 Tax=Silene latifolia TaxID=37657 RepID=UPI003D76CF3E
MSEEINFPANEALATLLRPAFGFIDAMALKCVVKLGIPDIIHSHGRPISLTQIATQLESNSPGHRCLARVMHVMSRRGIFASTSSLENEILYDLTPSSRLILKDSSNNPSYAPIILMLNDPELLAPLHYLSFTVTDGGVAFEKAHNCSIWEYLAEKEDVNKIFHDGLACTAKIAFRVIATEYKDVFASVQSVVDVGGGTGTTAHEIVKAHPHIKAINFDLPHVIAIAPKYDGVTHVVGDMFKAIPNGDVVILKSILHDWDDDDCVKILKNCRKAVPEKTGKIIIFEQLVQQEGEGPIDDIVYASDLLMIAHTGGGKERTEAQCETLLKIAGFPRYRFIGNPGLPSIIEAYVE